MNKIAEFIKENRKAAGLTRIVEHHPPPEAPFAAAAQGASGGFYEFAFFF